MQRSLEELDRKHSDRKSTLASAVNALARDETPVRTRDAADGEGSTLASTRSQNAAALNVAEALVRENRRERRSRCA